MYDTGSTWGRIGLCIGVCVTLSMLAAGVWGALIGQWLLGTIFALIGGLGFLSHAYALVRALRSDL